MDAMSRVKILAVGAIAAVAALVPASSASATTVDATGQEMTATSTNLLSIGVPTIPASLATLTPGQSSVFTPLTYTIVAPSGSWTLAVADSTGNNGQLTKDSGSVLCTGGAGTTADHPGNALTYSSSSTVAGTTDSGTLGNSASTVGHGTNSLADSVVITYTQPQLSTSVQLKALCPYKTTVTYTLSG
jgi:hypothetical protein